MKSTLASRWRAAAIASVALLITLVFAWQCATEVTVAALTRAMLFSIPLLLPLPGLLRGRRFTYRWATLCVLPYFVVAITEAFANATVRMWALAMLGIALLWFFTLIGFIRVTTPQ